MNRFKPGDIVITNKSHASPGIVCTIQSEYTDGLCIVELDGRTDRVYESYINKVLTYDSVFDIVKKHCQNPIFGWCKDTRKIMTKGLNATQKWKIQRDIYRNGVVESMKEYKLKEHNYLSIQLFVWDKYDIMRYYNEYIYR